MKISQIKIVHIISGLKTGGAENVLFRLLSNIDRNTFKSQVISLTGFDEIGEKIKNLRIPVIALGMSHGIPNPFYLLRLIKIIKKFGPDIIQTWMYHADLLGGIAGKLSGSDLILWNIRTSALNSTKIRKTTILTIRLCAGLSYFLPKLILSVSEAAKKDAMKQGYNKNQILIIPNGVDTNIFKPNHLARRIICEQLNIPEKSFFIGLIARFDPQKDHQNFITAAKIIYTQYPNVSFILCGEGVTWENDELKKRILEANLADNFYLLGRREDIYNILASLDLSVLSSAYGEGFPNVMIESMACGVPCIATDVGDSKKIINGTGKVVPAKDSLALANSILELINLDIQSRRILGKKARLRIEKYYSLKNMVTNYEQVYKRIILDRYQDEGDQ